MFKNAIGYIDVMRIPRVHLRQGGINLENLRNLKIVKISGKTQGDLKLPFGYTR